MMQGLHHPQQQLAALLSVALKKDSSASTASTAAASAPSSGGGGDADESNRVSALNSLHHFILYPPNSVLVAHSATFLCQGLFQLLSDNSHTVRRSAATTYGALCSVLCSVILGSNALHNHALLTSLVDRFINWSLPSLRINNATNGSIELALEAIREFLSVGDAGAVERYSFPALKAFKELLEDERTSITLLHQLLDVLTVISLKFFRTFQNHFADIVDLLLGWAMIPDIAESDTRAIISSFMQFQKHWVVSLQFPLGLLLKFLGDMDVLLQDGNLGTPQQFRRLVALLSCFSTVLQSTASGLLELNLLGQIVEPLNEMIPNLLGCLSMVGKKFGWSKWYEDLWRCLTLLAEILCDKFSNFYPLAVDILFQSLGSANVTSFQTHGVLKTNLQLLSLQKHGLLSSSVKRILQFDGPISQLRLHPNHLVTSSSAATYIFLLQHEISEVVECAITSLLEELILLHDMLETLNKNVLNAKLYSRLELLAFFNFDLKVLPGAVFKFDLRSEKVLSFILLRLNPVSTPISNCMQWQVCVFEAVNSLSSAEFLRKCSIQDSIDNEERVNHRLFSVTLDHLTKYSPLIIKGLELSCPLAVKLKALDWVHQFADDFVTVYENSSVIINPSEDLGFSKIVRALIFSVLNAALDRELKVRSQAALVSEKLLRSKLVHPAHLYKIGERILEKIGDSDAKIRSQFVRLFADILPIAIYLHGQSNEMPYLHWKQIFALKQLPQHIHPQQLVSILGFISQRWKMPISSWIQRLIYSCQSVKEETDLIEIKHEKDLLEATSSVNHLAGVWWAINEAARYCTSTRLRTNLGGPTQSFAALERMLLDVAHVLQIDAEQSDGSLSIIGSSGAHLLPMRLLLDFVEALKKNVYNAYNGSTVLPRASRQSSLFFRANKKVCEEWFSRICEPMMNAALALQYHDATFHYCSLRLQELKSSLNDHSFVRVVRYMALALCKKREPDMLIGLQKWVCSSFSAEEKQIPGDLLWINGLVYEAKGQYEKSSAFFAHLLQKEDSLNSMGAEGIQFAISRVIQGYNATSDWKSLEEWLSELQSLRAKHAGKSYSRALNTAGNEMNAIHAMAHFDEQNLPAAWACLDLTPKSSCELTLDPKLALQRSEQMLLQAMIYHCEGELDKLPRETQRAKSMLDEVLTVIPLDGIMEATPYATQLHCIYTLEEANRLNKTESTKLLDSALCFSVNKVNQDCSSWLKLFRVYRTISPTSSTTLGLCKSIMTLARKQGNLELARRLQSYLKDNIHSLSELASSLQYEEILMMHAENKVVDAVTEMWSFVRPCLISCDSSYLKAKACLKLSAWLRQSLDLESVVPKIFKECNIVGGGDVSMKYMLDEIVGATLEMSTRMCPAMGKSWISYASWCFAQAKEKIGLTKDEISQVESTISTLVQEIGCGNDTISTLVQDVLESTAEAPGVDDFDGQSISAYVVSQLQKIFLSKLNVEEAILSSSIDALVNVWWTLRRRRVSMFGQAAHGFIQFLSHSSSKLSDNPLITALNYGSISQNSVSLTLRATLFILHILLNYGVELKDMLEPALSSVPLSPWQEITPQLFARLSSHSEPVIRKQLEGLLMMLAKLSPRSIVYPTLVDINTSDKDPPEELQHILDCLMKHYPRLVQDVKLMMHELGNVTVLWEELWLSTLQDLHGDVMRRLNLLKEEAARIADNNTLSHTEKRKISGARYSAMMAPIFVALERRLALTSRKPETPHEKWFQEEYQEQLKSAIYVFKSPPVSGAPLAEVWHTFDTIAASLAAYQRKSTVPLDEVAPQLGCLSSSDIPMPGLEKQDTQGIITIASFSQQVSILSTKTKPKKIVMLGSNGEKYTYLLKGREDLRLDARIMQLLEAVNNILHSCSETKVQSVGIRYYSVTPISGCAGLIQWVDNVISIYSVFKSWQQRIHHSQMSARESNAHPVPRPSDMFYGKIIPALKEKGIRRAISRRDWPHEVKRMVLLELMEETPKQLLHQELWCVSEDFKAFSSKLKRYSGSLAAMSVVGHILGLGDRHLDNILMDFVSGDIVHIDYNVCFDKGQRLKVPEIVPFRLTQTLEAALGLTGVEGQFRANCESVVGVLRKNKDILLMLLEVFVWDPLVEWTRGDFHDDDAALGGEERKGMELAVSLSLFASRVQEIRIPLQEHHDLLLEAIPSVESALKSFMDALSQYEVVYTNFYRVDQERSALLTHETTAKSLVAETMTSSEKARISYEIQAQEFNHAKSLLIEKTQEATTWIELHGRVIDALRSGSLPEFEISIKLNDVQNSLTLTSAVSAAGVPLTIVPEPTQAQCYDIDREISQIMVELDHGVSSAVKSLQAYSLALQRVLPLNYLTTSPMHGWAQVLQICTNTISSDTLSRARRQATELIARGNRGFLDSVSLSLDDLCRKVDNYALEIRKLEDERSELVGSIGCEAESNAKDQLRSAFIKFMHMDGKALSILYSAVCSVYEETKCQVIGTLTGKPRSDFEGIFCELEEQIEKCIVVEEFVREVRQLVDGEMIPASRFKAALCSCKDLFTQMTDVVMPDLISYILSSRSEVMDVFRSISQIRGTVETALEQLVQIELERESLSDLERSYFVEVGVVTEQQLAIEEAAMKGRDQLSWEEADELASQEEICRAKLNQLHHKLNQNNIQASNLTKKEAAMKHSLASSEIHFLSLLDDNMIHRVLANPFSVLESLDKTLSTYCAQANFSPSDISLLVNCLSSGRRISEHVWRFRGLVNGNSFFVWKLGVIDSVLELVVHDVPSLIDQSMGFEQLTSAVKNKLVTHLYGILANYFKGQIAPALLNWLNEAVECYQEEISGIDELAARKVQMMLEEYCSAHETIRAARSASSVMEKKIADLKEAIRRTTLEIVQTEWMRDVTSPISHKFFEEDDRLHILLLNLSRPKLLEALQSAVSLISRSTESLQSCEINSAEGQLERAMNWACGGAGIPPEFHNHLTHRRQLLMEAQEKAKDVIQVCLTVLEFEASRDGYLGSFEEITLNRGDGDCRTWQQNYLNALMRLDVTFHSYSRAEQEWSLAQSKFESASNSLLSASNELQIASVKAKSASGDLQSTLLQMKDCACETSVALSAFSRAVKLHTALTSECSSMLEEVLAITGLHDVLNLGKEAASVHHSLMEELSKASAILDSLESVLSKDVSTMTDAMERERETKSEISPIHGQAICQSYSVRLREAYQSYNPSVPLLMSHVKELYSLLSKLAQTASLHAGNLHKALEGLGEVEDTSSQQIKLSIEENLTPQYENGHAAVFPALVSGSGTQQERGWISPPHSDYSSDSATLNSDIGFINDDVDLSEEVHTDETLNQVSSTRTTDQLPARVTRGKNAFAVSVLRRIEMKIDGRDIDGTRQISISEQVDHLVKQATSIDNLCNMYEGWTPWI